MKTNQHSSPIYKPLYSKALGKCWPLMVASLPKNSVLPKPLPSSHPERWVVFPCLHEQEAARVFAALVPGGPPSSKMYHSLEHSL